VWTTETPEPQPVSSTLERGPVSLSVAPANKGDRQWQHFLLSFGRYHKDVRDEDIVSEITENDHAECLRTWPREALRLAREKLNKFEEQLNEEEED